MAAITDNARTLADGWAFAKFYSSEKARRAALPAFLHDYNHRPHTAIGKLAPMTRLTDLAGHHRSPYVRQVAEVSAEWISWKSCRARYRLRQRMMSRLVRPSAVRLAT